MANGSLYIPHDKALYIFLYFIVKIRETKKVDFVIRTPKVLYILYFLKVYKY